MTTIYQPYVECRCPGMGKLHVKDTFIDNMNLSVDQELVTATSRQKVLALEYVWKTSQVTRTGQCHLKVCVVFMAG